MRASITGVTEKNYDVVIAGWDTRNRDLRLSGRITKVRSKRRLQHKILAVVGHVSQDQHPFGVGDVGRQISSAPGYCLRGTDIPNSTRGWARDGRSYHVPRGQWRSEHT